MIIKVKDQIEREITIEFPISFKTSESIFVHCYNEDNAIMVFTGSGVFHRFSSIVAMGGYKPEMNCDKSEVDEAFSRVVNAAQREVLNPIVIDLYSNSPTEELENLNTILFGHDEG